MAKKIDDNRLLPCPFCGEDAAIWYFPQHDRPLLKEAYYVGCTNDNCDCELEHPGAFKSIDDAVSAWNRRYKEPTTKNDSSELDKNSKKLEKPTTENDLGVDCISRDSALKALDYDIKSFKFKSGISEHMDDIAKLLDTIYEIQENNIKALPSVTPQEPRWIHVEEKMPEDGQSVLFCDIDNDIMIGYHIKGRPNAHFSQDGTYEDIKNVRAWMPLPKPYSEVEE